MHLAEVRLGDLDHDGIELGHVHALDRRVLEQLLGGAAVAAADHESALARRRMRDRRGMDEVLVVEELVALATSC